MGDEHRHSRAVLARIKNLLDFVIVRVDFHLRAAEKRLLPVDHIVMIDARRRGKAGKHVKRFDIGPLAGKTRHRADAGQIPRRGRTGRRWQILSPAVATSLRYEAINRSATKLTCVKVPSACGMISFQSGRFGLRRSMAISRRRGASRSVLKNNTGPSLPTISIFVVEIVDYLDRHGVRLGQILHGDAVAVGTAQLDGDDQIAAVVGDFAAVEPFGMFRPKIDQHVVRLRRADLVVIEFIVEIEGLIHRRPDLGSSKRL